MLSPNELAQYRQDGYLQVPGLFQSSEMQLLLETARTDKILERMAVGLGDGRGGTSRLSLWYQPGDDLYGIISRSERIVKRAEQLLDAPVYHYHSKMMLKEPRTGGAWVWHQDYGYWYYDGYLFPDMLSCLIAIDKADRQNGCLQVLKGSHRLGRLDHAPEGQQEGVNPEALEAARQRFELVHCEMEPGTALFFHSNLLHASDQNKSERPRWSLICCFTAEHNLPYKSSSHPGYEPIKVVPDAALMEAGGRHLEASRAFLERIN